MDAKRITLLLPSAIVEAAERAAAAKNTTRHNFLCDLIISQISGETAEDKDAKEIRKIADLQRACISIMATWWGETNPEAPTKIRNIAGKIGVKI